MSIGSGIVIFVIGAILRFALNVEVSWIDLHLVGNILMGAGVLIFVIGLVYAFRRKRSVSTRHTVRDGEGVHGVTRKTSTVDDTEL